MKKENGITLVVLIVTIIILIILTGLGISISSDYLNDAKLKTFYTKLEIAKEGIIKISDTNEKYKDEENNIVIIKEQGANPTADQIQLIESLGYDSTRFKYFTAEEVESILGIYGVDLNLLVDFGYDPSNDLDDNTAEVVVINPEGIEVDGEMYYALEDNKYTVQLDKTKTSGPVDFNYTVENYGSKYKITITPVNIGNIKEGTIKYKKSFLDFWTVADGNVIIVKNLTYYDIMYTDAKGNTITKTISLSLDAGNNVIATE